MTRTDENARLLELALEGDKLAEEELVRLNLPLVKSIAVRFTGRGQDIEDLIQIGTLGMLRAIRCFDKSYGTVFSTYAVPLITGEIKRFLRDDGLIKVSREAKRNNGVIMKAKENYLREYGRTPRVSELCEICDLSEEEIVYAVNACMPSVSLEQKISDDGEKNVGDLIADEELFDITERIALHEAVEKLEKEEKNIVYLRYFKGLTQNETAKIMGLNQVKVSRNEKKIVAKLKHFMEDGA